MAHKYPWSATDVLDTTFRLYRRHVAAFVRSVVGALLPFLLFWVVLAVGSGNGIDWLRGVPIRPDVFIQFFGALDAGEPLRDLWPLYSGSIVFFFVLQVRVTNSLVQLAARLVGGDAMPPSRCSAPTNPCCLRLRCCSSCQFNSSARLCPTNWRSHRRFCSLCCVIIWHRALHHRLR